MEIHPNPCPIQKSPINKSQFIIGVYFWIHFFCLRKTMRNNVKLICRFLLCHVSAKFFQRNRVKAIVSVVHLCNNWGKTNLTFGMQPIGAHQHYFFCALFPLFHENLFTFYFVTNKMKWNTVNSVSLLFSENLWKMLGKWGSGSKYSFK